MTLFGGSLSHGRDRKVGDFEVSKSQARSGVFLFLLPEELDIEILATALAPGLPAGHHDPLHVDNLLSL